MKIVSMSCIHLDEVAELEKECFVHPWSRDSLDEYLNNPSAYFFVAIDDNKKVLGYVGTYIICDEAYVTNVAVSKGARRQGIGHALIERAVENARQNRASFISLEVRFSNMPAIGLYKSFEFISEGVRPNFYRDPEEDALIMTKRFERGLGI